ncbi:MAG: glycosyltransferase [Saprospirales bacterium]|nr:MAG: glycosyltransferase [Saprospirales bacterium]
MKKKRILKRALIAVSNDVTMDQRMNRIAGALHEYGVSVMLVGRRLPHSLPLAEKPFEQRRLRCFFNRGPLFYTELQIRLFFFFLIKNYDLLIAVDPDTLPAMWCVKTLRGGKLLFDSHELFDQVPELENKPVVRWVWKKIVRLLAPRADFRWTVNQSVADILQNQTGVPFEVVRNLPEINPFPEIKENATHRNRDLILYQGRLNKGRGLEEMIDAMSRLEDFKLVLAGGGDLEKELRERVKEKDLDNVVITGNLRPEELNEWTSKAWLGLNLLDKTSGNYYHSLANKFLDYMAFGVPSISMDFPEYRNLNDQYHFSLLIHDLRVETIIEAVKLLDSDPELYRKLHRNACNAARFLNWQREKLKVNEVLQGL